MFAIVSLIWDSSKVSAIAWVFPIKLIIFNIWWFLYLFGFAVIDSTHFHHNSSLLSWLLSAEVLLHSVITGQPPVSMRSALCSQWLFSSSWTMLWWGPHPPYFTVRRMSHWVSLNFFSKTHFKKSFHPLVMGKNWWFAWSQPWSTSTAKRKPSSDLKKPPPKNALCSVHYYPDWIKCRGAIVWGSRIGSNAS